LRRNVDLVVSAIILWNTTHLECAIGRTIEQFESTGSPVITDGEQRKYHNFATYCVEGGRIPHQMGSNCHSRMGARRWPRLTSGRFSLSAVVSSIDPRIEDPEEIRDRILEAARYIPVEQLGTTDECGFSPFCDDTSTTREKAFAKIRSRVEGDAAGGRIINGK
jgi:hypothetical protein